MKGGNEQSFAMTVTSKGQVTLPAEFRKAAGISTGDKIDLVLLPSGETSLRVRKGRLADLRGIIAWPHGPISDQALEQMISDARTSRFRR